MPQQVNKARVLVPVPELRSHAVVQVLTTAAREPERIRQVRVVGGAGRSQRLARVARGIERVEAADPAAGVAAAEKPVGPEARHADHAAVGVLYQNCLIAVVSESDSAAAGVLLPCLLPIPVVSGGEVAVVVVG